MNGPEETQLVNGGEDGGVAEPGLETALREALRHEDAPAGFTDRVMARALSGEGSAVSGPPAARRDSRGKLLQWPLRRLWLRGGIAAGLILGLFEGEVAYKRIREQQRRIAEATAQFQTTERVTVHALAQAREQLQRAGVPLTLD